MRVDVFDFELPSDRIALRPADPRDSAQLLVVEPSKIHSFSDIFLRDLPDQLRSGDCLVVNNTRVLPARLFGSRHRDGAVASIEATLHKRESSNAWLAFVRPAKKLKIGESVIFRPARRNDSEEKIGHLQALVADKREGGEVLLQFEFSGEELDTAVRNIGTMPLPPYIAAKRAEDEHDHTDYQTMFAARTGAVAAPTAGLHFTPALLEKIGERGVNLAEVTLHVGAGTFLPVKVEDISQHAMHAEWGEITASTADLLNSTRANGGRIVAVGTTSLRLLESAVGDNGTFNPWSGDTAIFITPGYRFKAVDLLITNFHLPKSTLFMLVSAFSGLDTMQKAYKHAIQAGYRFYSYGDACFLHRSDQD